ncbi:hypothetical protein GCM10009552_15630 [Rothia nasimurium]|uniref:DUF1772 domain-containing protein n=1 Tax=Luteibacter anthropi TaxID=564369 RepID=A0A7X5UBD6_9GAMM|nr:hypothetical protein [Luteibacter anthropi]NII07227.1 hypothetical protein [Luteibacter anthropi]
MTFLKSTAKQLLAVIGAISSLFSGVLWNASAKIAVQVAGIVDKDARSHEVIAKLQAIALMENSWASWLAVVTGVSLAIAVALD